MDESSLNTKTPAVDRKDMTKSLNPGQTLVRVKDQRKAFEGNLKQPLDMDNQKLNTDIDMEIIPDLPENLLGINTTSLRSWKRILRNPNLQSSSEVSASQHHPRKRPPITPPLPLIHLHVKSKSSGRTQRIFPNLFVGVPVTPYLQHENSKPQLSRAWDSRGS